MLHVQRQAFAGMLWSKQFYYYVVEDCGFVKSLALELRPYGIRVNAVAPGLTDTDATSFIPQESKGNVAQMTPLRRNGQPEEVAGAIVLLASQEAKFITGTYLLVNGGLQML